MIKKNKKKYDKIVLLVKWKLSSIEVSISMALIDLVISHDEFIWLNNDYKNITKWKNELKT